MKKNKSASLKRILPFFKGHKKELIFAVFFVIMMVVLQQTLPLIFRKLVDFAIPSKNLENVAKIAFLYLGVLILSNIFQYFQGLIVGYMGISIVNTIKKKLLKHILGLSIRFFDKNPPGKLISRIESDSQKLYMLFSQIGLNILGAILNISLALIIMFTVNVKLTLFVISVSPIFMIGSFIVFTKLRALFRKERELYSKIGQFLGEHIKGITLLRNLNNLNWSIKKFEQINEEKRRYELKIFRVEQAIWTVMMLAPQFAIALIIYQNVTWIKAGTMTLGTLWMFIQYINAAIFPIIMISEQLGEVQRAFGASDKIFEILDTDSEISKAKNPTVQKSFNSEIRFENVSFHYEEDKPVLNNVNFSVKQGSTVAIVGATGSGKTTIISLINRFYDPIKGKILIDGVDLRDLDLEDWRQKLSLVLQDIYLFPGNLKDNLRVLRSDVSDEKIFKAVETLGIKAMIENMPDKYDSQISEEGHNLSYGQRQLLSFSRALTFEPEILIMDEATSAVDPLTESQIQKSMDKMMQNRTAIIIAHRLATVEHADKIIVLDKGEVVEEGSHQELLNKEGLYANLYNTQMGNHNDEGVSA